MEAHGGLWSRFEHRSLGTLSESQQQSDSKVMTNQRS